MTPTENVVHEFHFEGKIVIETKINGIYTDEHEVTISSCPSEDIDFMADCVQNDLFRKVRELSAKLRKEDHGDNDQS